MGGSKKQTTGYYYRIGAHLVLCRGLIDKIVEIQVQKKTGFRGNWTGGQIYINKQGLFGGKKKEGGLEGRIDLLTGEATQLENDYLLAKQGSTTPAYRGVVSVVLRSFYIGTNPYLKPWRFRTQRVYLQEDGSDQWYKEKAGIGTAILFEDAAVYIALDWSGSQLSGTRLQTQKDGVKEMLTLLENNLGELPSDIRMVAFNSSVKSSIERTSVGASDFADLRAWVDGLSDPLATDKTSFDAALSQAEAFFLTTGEKRKVTIFVTDGVPDPPSEDGSTTAAALDADGVEMFGFNVEQPITTATEVVDNTDQDGVPVLLDGDSSGLAQAMANAFANGLDMNPAHILRECITNTVWGIGDQPGNIGDSFTDAADTLFSEKFGLSFHWRRTTEVEEFMQGVLNHIDATVFVDNSTGKWEMKLIRNDYEVGSLPVIDDDSVIELGNDVERIDPVEAINSYTIQYTNGRTGEKASLTVKDTALIAEAGVVRSKADEFNGIHNKKLASRVGLRELLSVSSPLITGSVTLNRKIAAQLLPGSPFVMNLPRFQIINEILRVINITNNPKNDESIDIEFASDLYAISDTSVVSDDGATAPDINNAPEAIDRRVVEEATFWWLAQNVGDTEAINRLTTSPDQGFLFTAGESPTNDSTNAEVVVDAAASGTFVEVGVMDFVPVATLDGDLTDDPTNTVVAIRDPVDLEDSVSGGVEVGSIASIGSELVRVDAISSSSVTLGRGCLDTLPQAHSNGDPIVFWENPQLVDDTEYSAAETIDVKLLTTTPLGTLPVAEAPTDQVAFDSRAVRPFPVGNFQCDGEYRPASAIDGNSDVVLTWAHRDRLSQTSSVLDDYTTGNIGPEAGVDYTVLITWRDDAGAQVGADLVNTSVGTDVTYTLTSGFMASRPAGAVQLWFQVRTARDGYNEWQTPTIKRNLALGYGASYGASYGN